MAKAEKQSGSTASAADDYMEGLESVAKLVGDLALSIADAQDRMDVAYVKNLAGFAKVMASATKRNAVDGSVMAGLFKSMAPSRYQFTETVVETRADLQMSTGTQLAGDVKLGRKTPVLAATVNASYVKRSGYDYRAAASIRTVIQAVPPDAAVLATLTRKAAEIESPQLPQGSREQILATAVAEVAPRLPAPGTEHKPGGGNAPAEPATKPNPSV